MKALIRRLLDWIAGTHRDRLELDPLLLSGKREAVILRRFLR